MLQPGDSFGDYRVLKLLGKGGMGAVFLLENAEGVQVAAKILDPAEAGDHEARKRFLREAQLALEVKHPNLVETYDIGEDPETGFCYILMEYVSGGSLADYLKENGALPIEDAVAVVQAMASVLELAREKGIVHRDIKPGNIMFDAEGTPKLADLGIARGGLAGTETTTVTQTGMMIGTPAYMAPEQMLDAHKVDTRADIYSLGVVFFEMLTGERPNKDDTVVQLMAKAVKGEPLPDVRTLRPEVSASLAQLLAMMVAPDKDGRISTPGQITSAIDIIERGGTFAAKPTASTETRSQRKPFPWKALIPVGLLAGLAAAFVIFAPKRETQRIVTTNVVERVVEKKIVMTNTVERNVVRTRTVTNDMERASVSRMEAVPVANSGIRTSHVGGFDWNYRLENGNAVLEGSPGGFSEDSRPAVSPYPSGRLAVPAELDGHRVVAIGQKAFFGCRDLEAIEIPEGVSEIRGMWTFFECLRLTEVKLPRTLRRIAGEFVFMRCQALEELDLRLCERLSGMFVFQCPKLKRFRCAPENTGLKVEEGVIYDRSGKTLILWPGDDECPVLPPGVRVVGDGAFCYRKLRRIDIPEGVVSIGAHAFHGCSRLESVRIPVEMKSIGMIAFIDCISLTNVAFAGDAPAVLSRHGLFGRTPEDMTISVKRGTKGWDRSERWPPDDRSARRVRYELGSEPAEVLSCELPPRPGDFDWLESQRQQESRPLRVTIFSWPKQIGSGEVDWAKGYFTGLDMDVQAHVMPNANLRSLRTKDMDLAFFWSRYFSDRYSDDEVTVIEGYLNEGGNVVVVSYQPGGAQDQLLNHFGLKVKKLATRLESVAVCPGLKGLPVPQKAMGRGHPTGEEDESSWRSMIVRKDKANHYPVMAMRRVGRGRLFFLSSGLAGDSRNDRKWWQTFLRACYVASKDGTLDASFPGWKPEAKGHVANEKSVSDDSATKAVQKTLNALFPGWKTSENAKRGAEHMEGYVRNHLGREDCVCTHPQSLDQPEVVLHRDLVVPKKNPVLRFSVAAFVPMSEFRVQAKANGMLVFEEDVAGGKWRDVCVDLSRWAGKQAKIELVHRAIGWNWEWAFWWRMEVGEWDGQETRLAKLMRAEKLADRSRYADPDPTKAVRKAFKALFPGWTVSENGGGAEYIGYYEEFKHRHNLVMTHPPREGVPVILTNAVKVPKNGATLHLEVASHSHGDFELEVHVHGKVVRRELITPERDFADIDVDLSEYAGKSVKVEILQVPNNWQWEMAFWSKIEVKRR